MFQNQRKKLTSWLITILFSILFSSCSLSNMQQNMFDCCCCKKKNENINKQNNESTTQNNDNPLKLKIVVSKTRSSTNKSHNTAISNNYTPSPYSFSTPKIEIISKNNTDIKENNNINIKLNEIIKKSNAIQIHNNNKITKNNHKIIHEKTIKKFIDKPNNSVTTSISKLFVAEENDLEIEEPEISHSTINTVIDNDVLEDKFDNKVNINTRKTVVL